MSSRTRSRSSGPTASSTATGRPTPPWSTPRRPAGTPGAGAVARRQPRGRPAGTRGEGRDRRAGLRQRPPPGHVAARGPAGRRRRGRGLRPSRDRRGDEGQRGVRLGEPHRPAPCGPRPQRRLRRLGRRLFERCGYRVERRSTPSTTGAPRWTCTPVRWPLARLARTCPRTGTGEYIAEWATEMPDDADPLEWGEQRALEDHRQVLEQMNVHFDTWTSGALVERARSTRPSRI